jgi:hypothetical protein
VATQPVVSRVMPSSIESLQISINLLLHFLPCAVSQGITGSLTSGAIFNLAHYLSGDATPQLPHELKVVAHGNDFRSYGYSVVLICYCVHQWYVCPHTVKTS